MALFSCTFGKLLMVQCVINACIDSGHGGVDKESGR